MEFKAILRISSNVRLSVIGYRLSPNTEYRIPNTESAFTLVELIMVMAIIGLLAFPGTLLMVNLMHNSVFIPNKMNMDMIAEEALNTMIEGDSRAGGLRFSKAITKAQDNQITFINQDNQSITYRLDTAANMLYRKIDANPEEPLIYYASSAIDINGKLNRLFSYYDANESNTNDPALVRRLKITLISKIGSGSYDDWQAQSEQSSSIKVSVF